MCVVVRFGLSDELVGVFCNPMCVVVRFGLSDELVGVFIAENVDEGGFVDFRFVNLWY